MNETTTYTPAETVLVVMEERARTWTEQNPGSGPRRGRYIVQQLAPYEALFVGWDGERCWYGNGDSDITREQALALLAHTVEVG